MIDARPSPPRQEARSHAFITSQLVVGVFEGFEGISNDSCPSGLSTPAHIGRRRRSLALPGGLEVGPNLDPMITQQRLSEARAGLQTCCALIGQSLPS
jgi:hypothetical protein